MRGLQRADEALALLVLEPLKRLSRADLALPLVVLVDALDEARPEKTNACCCASLLLLLLLQA